MVELPDPLDIVEVPVGHEPSGIQSLLSSPPGPSIRKFADPQLQASIDRALASLPFDSKAAELTVGFDPRGVQLVGVVKLDHGWSILGGVFWNHDEEWGGKVSVRRAWK